MSDKIKTLSDKMTSIQKIVVTAIAIVGALWVGGWQAVEAIDQKARDREDQRIEEITKVVTKVLRDEGMATQGRLDTISDILLTEIEVNRITNDSLHRRAFTNQRQIMYAIDDARYSDSTVQKRINQIEQRINELRGITMLTREEQAAQAYTDSLIGANVLLKQKELYRARMRQSEAEFEALTRELRDLSKDIVIDKGRRKTIRSKPKGSKQGPVTKGDRILFDF
jgi:hypothetical protein